MNDEYYAFMRALERAGISVDGIEPGGEFYQTVNDIFEASVCLNVEIFRHRLGKIAFLLPLMTRTGLNDLAMEYARSLQTV